MSTVLGLDSLMRKLNALGGNVDRALDKGVMKAGLLVEGDAKDLCTTDTGRLKNSIHTVMGGSSDTFTFKDDSGKEFAGGLASTGEDTHVAIVGTNVEYSAMIEFGTGQKGMASPQPPGVNVSYTQDWVGMEAQPYLWPALQQNKDNIKAIISEELIKEIRKLGG